MDGIDLHVPSGEFFSLLGPSGCGKTTTLRMIAGFEQPTSGQILLDGSDVAYTPPHHRNVNTVFQNYALFPHLNVFDNIAFGLRRAKAPEGGDPRARRRRRSSSFSFRATSGASPPSSPAASSSASPWRGRSS